MVDHNSAKSFDISNRGEVIRTGSCASHARETQRRVRSLGMDAVLCCSQGGRVASMEQGCGRFRIYHIFKDRATYRTHTYSRWRS